MEMHQLRYFAKVAELGNVTRAAEACFVSQPSLSQQLGKLERELGQPLLERMGRGVQLTHAGERFRHFAEQILLLADEAKGSLSDSEDSGRLTIAAIPTVAPYFLPSVLTRFLKLCPKAQIEIVEETTERILRLLTDGDADLAILALPVRQEHLEVQPLLTEPLLTLLPTRHRLAKRPKLELNDLRDEPFVLLHEAHCLSENVLSFCARNSLAPLVTARAHQLAMVFELVRLGHGISLVPAMAAHHTRGLKFRELTTDQPSRTLALARSRLRFQSKLSERFVHELTTPRSPATAE